MLGYTEADYENSVIELFKNDLGYEYAYGPDIERDFYSPLYEEVLLDSLYRLNRGCLMTQFRTPYSSSKTLKTESLCRKTLSLWTICKTVFLLDILLTVGSVPLSSISLTTKIPTITPLSLLTNGLLLRTVINAPM